MDIRTGHLDHPGVVALLREHLHALGRLTPADSMHALGIDRLKAPDITFWSAWDGEAVIGCAALRHLDDAHGELKSMRTCARHLRRGVATRLLDTALAEARLRGYARVSLETGVTREFAAAHALYRRAGFRECGPFGAYRHDPHSLFMTLETGVVREAAGATAVGVS
ncbi:GNAT family N-acetyltransferase [Lysobacter sp. N42]|uniref:GNAT family N-acetyltransferase n=1 Tax=Lysobacter sp. N42 TaxID=2545719 RepID=UPI001047D2D0|nr:GNAT family N-acetyltransferase [Lysobacter sp. N42]TCZ83619.1 GNAT family N-acetyltransferase [Lysobacter sp. N42]